MNVTFPELLRFNDLGLLLLRLMVATVFFTSGVNHLKDPTGRAKSIGASPGFTIFLGAGEVLGSTGVALGVFTQLLAKIVSARVVLFDFGHSIAARRHQRHTHRDMKKKLLARALRRVRQKLYEVQTATGQSHDFMVGEDTRGVLRRHQEVMSRSLEITRRLEKEREARGDSRFLIAEMCAQGFGHARA